MPKQTFYVCVEDTVLGTEAWYTVRALSKETAMASIGDRASVPNVQYTGGRLVIHGQTEKPEWM